MTSYACPSFCCSSTTSGKPFLTFSHMSPYLRRTPQAPRIKDTQACPYLLPNNFFSFSLVSPAAWEEQLREGGTHFSSPFCTQHNLRRDGLSDPQQASACLMEEYSVSLGLCPDTASRQPTWNALTTNFSHKNKTSHAANFFFLWTF